MENYPRWDVSAGPVKCKGCRKQIIPGAGIFIKARSVYYCESCGPLAEAVPDSAKPGGIEEGLLLDLGRFPDEAIDTSLARQAVYMARQLDCGEVGPREVTQYTKEIRLNLLQIRELYPPDEENDDTEERNARLQERRRREQGGI